MMNAGINNGYEPIERINNVQEIYNEDKDEIKLRIFGYVKHHTSVGLYHLCGIIFFGIPYLISQYFPKYQTFKYRKSSLEDATILLASDDHGNSSLINIKTEKIKLPYLGPNIVDIRYFFYQHTKYVWIPERGTFSTLDSLSPQLTTDDYLNDTDGLNTEDYISRLTLYGPNKIEVEVKSYCTLFVEEVLNPFYIFQIFSVSLWMIEDYMAYAVCMVILTLFSSVTSLIQTRRQSEALHDLVESSKCHEVIVLRQQLISEPSKQLIDPTELVPGDMIILPPGNFIMPCDAVLLKGQCIVNESVLTGESVPVTKTALPSSAESFNTHTHKRHTLFSGTRVIQTRYYGGEDVFARVVRTGFDTTKGALVKSILYPAPLRLKFYKDSFKFIFVLFTLAAAGMGYTLYLHLMRHAEVGDMIIKALDVITVAVPAALPAVLAIGTVYSQNRLKKLGIYCISPPRINVCGKINIACFDKTGTLTHDGMNMNSVVPCNCAKFSNPVADISKLDIQSEFVKAMASCHSLTIVEGILNGDPLDLNMFEFTEWKLEEPGESENNRFDMLAPTIVKPNKSDENFRDYENVEIPYIIGIIRQFPFSSTLQCMSVICRELGKPHMMAFTKGAPEKLQSMCLPETLPADFSSRLSTYTAQGYRVIAVAYKNLPKNFKWKDAQKSKRDVIECDLTFLGLLIMQNPLKEQTAPVIKLLQKADIRSVMITGDNILTAISVAHDCGMVKVHDQVFIITTENEDNANEIPKIIIERAGLAQNNEAVSINFDTDHYHFAIDGKTWNKLRYFYPEAIPNLLVKTTIFARFQPDQKTQLVMYFQNLDYIVSMVGDGANDCGALKAAHVGVSLSQAEASVAAPFTSCVEDISCIIHLMMEGRCALVTSFALFKYMALYSLIEFTSILILYRQHSNLGDYQYLFIDLIVTTSLAVTIGRQGPSDKLGARRPLSSLIAAKNVIPLILQVATCAFIQVGALYYLYQQRWFTPIPSDIVEAQVVAWENTVLFTISCYQYVILATVYSKGKPYRQMLITNIWFLISAVGLVVFITWLLVYPCREMADLMEVEYVSFDLPDSLEKHKFRCTLLVIPIVHFILALFIEVGISDKAWLKKCIQFLKCKNIPKSKYKLLLQNNDNPWMIFNN